MKLDSVVCLVSYLNQTFFFSYGFQGGALGSNGWRERVDKLLMTTVTNACEGRWANAETYHHLPNKSSTDLVEFKLAALHAFLASLVSPSPVRPAFLAEGLELFQRGN